jgi:hypothetical protein
MLGNVGFCEDFCGMAGTIWAQFWEYLMMLDLDIIYMESRISVETRYLQRNNCVEKPWPLS